MAVFQDHSQSNNKDLSDDKYIIVPNNEEISVGSYIDWRKDQWLVFTEEHKTIPTHQQLKIKIVNEQIKWIKDGKICNDGAGWGAYVQNQTLYTLGVSASGNHMKLVDAKMMMYMQNNEETRMLKTNDRIFIGYAVYKVMFKDIVSRQGLINYLLEEDTLHEEYDNVELGIADYYKPGVLDPDYVAPDLEDEIIEIHGENLARLGKIYTYTIEEGYTVDEWIIDTIDNTCFEVQSQTETEIVLRVINDNRNVGLTALLLAKVGDRVASRTIRIGTKF